MSAAMSERRREQNKLAQRTHRRLHPAWPSTRTKEPNRDVGEKKKRERERKGKEG